MIEWQQERWKNATWAWEEPSSKLKLQGQYFYKHLYMQELEHMLSEESDNL